MNRRSLTLGTLAVALLLGIGTMTQALAQAEEKKAQPKLDRISGTIHMINKDTSVITVRTRNNQMRQVVYTPETKYTKRNKPGGSLDELKDGVRVICVGKFDENARLMASRIDIRMP